MNLKITVLGDNGGLPKANNACSSYLIQSRDANFLFDCGPGVISQLQSIITVDELTGIFISHFHQDHFSDLLSIIHAYDVGAELFGWKPLTIYSPYPSEEIKKLIDSPSVNNVYIDRLPGNEMNIQHEDLTLNVKKVKHTNTYDSYALNIVCEENKISFTGDMKEYSEDEINFFKKADILIADAYMLEEYKDSDSKHMSPTDAIRLGEKCLVDKLFLTHFYPVFEFSEYMNEIQNAKPHVPIYLPKPLENFVI